MSREEMQFIVYNHTSNGGGNRDQLMSKLGLSVPELPRAFRLDRYKARFNTSSRKAGKKKRKKKRGSAEGEGTVVLPREMGRMELLRRNMEDIQKVLPPSQRSRAPTTQQSMQQVFQRERATTSQLRLDAEERAQKAKRRAKKVTLPNLHKRNFRPPRRRMSAKEMEQEERATNLTLFAAAALNSSPNAKSVTKFSGAGNRWTKIKRAATFQEQLKTVYSANARIKNVVCNISVSADVANDRLEILTLRVLTGEIVKLEVASQEWAETGYGKLAFLSEDSVHELCKMICDNLVSAGNFSLVTYEDVFTGTFPLLTKVSKAMEKTLSMSNSKLFEKDFARALCVHHYKKGGAIYYQGMRADCMFLLCAGSVRFMAEDPITQTSKMVSAKSQIGQVFGINTDHGEGSTLFGESVRSSDAIASDHTTAIVLTIEELNKLCTKWGTLYEVMVEQTQDISRIEEYLVLSQARKRWSEALTEAHHSALKGISDAEVERDLAISPTPPDGISAADPDNPTIVAMIGGDEEDVRGTAEEKCRQQPPRKFSKGAEVLVTQKSLDFGKNGRVVGTLHGRVKVRLPVEPEETEGDNYTVKDFLHSELKMNDKWGDWNFRRKHLHTKDEGNDPCLRVWRMGDRALVTKAGSNKGQECIVCNPNWEGRVQVVMATDKKKEVRAGLIPANYEEQTNLPNSSPNPPKPTSSTSLPSPVPIPTTNPTNPTHPTSQLEPISTSAKLIVDGVHSQIKSYKQFGEIMLLGGRMSQKLVRLLEVKMVVCPQLLDSAYQAKHAEEAPPDQLSEKKSIVCYDGAMNLLWDVGTTVRITKQGTHIGKVGGVINGDWNGRVKVELVDGLVKSYLPNEIEHAA
jgi:hypothetical protein